MLYYKRLLRKLARVVVMLLLLLIAVYFTCQDKLIPFARQTEVIQGKSLTVECSPKYVKELNKHEGCAPKDCKRFISDKIISPKEVEELLAVAAFFFRFGFSTSGASVFDLHTGFLSNDRFFVNMFGMEETKSAITINDLNTFLIVKEKIKYAIANDFGVQSAKIYMTYPIFFSEITPKEGMTFNNELLYPHSENMSNHYVQYSTVLYLGDYNIDFKGGRFIFIDEKQNSSVEPRKGRLSVFTSGDENSYTVERVTWGARYAMSISFTCDEKYAIEDPDVNNYDKFNMKHTNFKLSIQ